MNPESFTACIDRLRVYEDRNRRDDLTERDLADIDLLADGIKRLVTDDKAGRRRLVEAQEATHEA